MHTTQMHTHTHTSMHVHTQVCTHTRTSHTSPLWMKALRFSIQQPTPEVTTKRLYLLSHGACEDQEGAESLQLLGCDGPHGWRAERGSRRLPAAWRLAAHVTIVLLQRPKEVIPGHRAGRPTCHISHSSGKLNVMFVMLGILQFQLTEKGFKKIFLF